MQTSNHMALHRWYHCQSCRVASWPFAGRILWSQAASLISERCLYYTTKSKKVNTPERLFSIFFRRRRMEARNGIGRSGCKAGRYHGPLLNAASISYRMRCGLDRRGLSVDGLNRRPDGGNFAMPQDPGGNEVRKPSCCSPVLRGLPCFYDCFIFFSGYLVFLHFHHHLRYNTFIAFLEEKQYQ